MLFRSIEIYNSNPFSLNMLDWIIKVNGTSYTLGNYIIPADSFIVLIHENNVGLFTGINVGGIPSFEGMTNESGLVELYYSNGTLLHATKYDIGYYDVAGKENGGWSLEMIDDSKPCLRNSNWTASQDVLGGTPGRKNSYSYSVNDNIMPHAIKTGLLGTDTLLIRSEERRVGKECRL